MLHYLYYFTSGVLFEDIWEGNQQEREGIELVHDSSICHNGHRWDGVDLFASEHYRRYMMHTKAFTIMKDLYGAWSSEMFHTRA